MMFRRGNDKSKAGVSAPSREKFEPDTVIGLTASFRGTVRADGSIRVDGVYEGSVETAGNLIIGKEAKVMADITAHNVSVAGAVKGDIIANRVEVLETGRVWGNLIVNSLTLDDGGFVSGEVSMHTDMAPPMLEAPKDREMTSYSEPIEGEIVGEEE